jgi:hypothetical protein
LEGDVTRKAGMLATALLGGLLAAGWLVTPPTNAQIFGLSESQEVELGREAARQVEREQRSCETSRLFITSMPLDIA